VSATLDRVVVTGGAGFIGSNLVRHLLARTSGRVIVMDALTYAGHLASLEDVAADPRFCFVRADIADAGAVASVFREHRPTAVVNLAAESHVDRSIEGPRSFLHTNLAGTFEMLEGARAYLEGADAGLRRVFRFLQVSTDEVFGSLGPEGAFREATPYAPRSPYSATKAGADHLVRAWHATYGLPTLVTNCSNNYGPYQYPEKLLPLMLLNAIEGRELPVYGDGGNVRDWLYVEDHCEALATVLAQGCPGESYNVGGECELTNLEVVRRLCQALERVHPAAANAALARRGVASYLDLVTFVADRPGHDRRYAMDASRLQRELGWRPRHDFASGLDATVRWYLDHRGWCEAVQGSVYRRQRLGLLQGGGAVSA